MSTSRSSLSWCQHTWPTPATPMSLSLLGDSVSSLWLHRRVRQKSYQAIRQSQLSPAGYALYDDKNLRALGWHSYQDIICLGGIFQVIDKVLAIPTSVVTLTYQAQLNNFIAILSRAQVSGTWGRRLSLQYSYNRAFTKHVQFLSVNQPGLIQFVDTASFTPNITFFIPDTSQAYQKFLNTSSDLSGEPYFSFKVLKEPMP